MGIIRNSIDIIGITPEDELPDKISGQLIEYSEVEHINIPEEKPRLGNIHQISIDIKNISNRVINAPTGKIIVLDGIKSLKIIYSFKGHSDKANIVHLQLPFNTFIEVPKTVRKIGDINIHIADAYFAPIEPRKLYSYILYFVDVNIPKRETSNHSRNHNKSSTTVPVNTPSPSILYIDDSSYIYNDMETSDDTDTSSEE